MPSVALVPLSGRSVLFVLFYELLIGWGLSALLLCVCPPRPWAAPSCLRLRWLYSDLPVKFWLPPLHHLCYHQALCSADAHTSGWSIPEALNKASGSRIMYRIWTEPVKVSHARIRSHCWLLLSQSQTMRWFVVDFHANIKWLMA